MDITGLPKEEVLKNLAASEDGLTREEAARRLREAGYNQIEKITAVSLWRRLLKQFTHYLAILLWIAAALAFISGRLYPGQGMTTLGLAILAVIFINAFFTFIQEYRAEKAMEALKNLLPFNVKAVRDGKEEEISAREVVPGDIVLLAEGDKVPADARLLAAADMRVNNAALTGESAPVERNARPFNGGTTASPNMVFAGTTVSGGEGKAVVFATGMATEFGRIAHLTGTVTAGPSPLQKETTRLTRIVAIIALGMAISFFIIGKAIGLSFFSDFLFAIGILVAIVPEGILPTMTLSLAIASQRMAKRKALLKTLTAVETLSSVSVICTDKTGTLTENRMSVTRMMDYSEGGKGGQPGLLTAAYLCSDAIETEKGLKGTPTEVAIYKAAEDANIKAERKRLAEFRFDPERMRMSTVNEINGKKYVLVKGAPEKIFAVCTKCARGARTEILEDCLREEAHGRYNALMDEGLRVLGFAYREAAENEEIASAPDAEKDLVFLGFIGIEDPPRPEVRGAIRKCRESGVRIIMITGDSSRTALAIAREIGLAGDRIPAYESCDVQKMSDEDLQMALSEDAVILSRMSPEHKLRIVDVLKARGDRVAMTGDGVNDAPALKRADIGIAMGRTGTDVAKEAADMVLMDDNFATIVTAIEMGKTVFNNIRKFTSYMFTKIIPELYPYLAFGLFSVPLPLTVIQIIGVELGTDIFPALALGSEKPIAEVIKTPPRSPRERLMSWGLLARAYLFLGTIEGAACLFGFFFVMHQGGWHWGQGVAPGNPVYLQATTACMCSFIVTQIANLFANRSFKESVFQVGLFANPYIFLGIGLEILSILIIVYTPIGNRIFATRPIPLIDWLVLVPFGVLLLLAEETRKLILRIKTKMRY